MTDRPILFSGAMVRAILKEIEKPGTGKTQTRRMLKPQPVPFWIGSEGRWSETAIEYTDGRDWPRVRLGRVITVQEVRFRPGMRLWVRETWQALSFGDYVPTMHHVSDVRYAATDPMGDAHKEVRGYSWRPGIHMPRWASRLTLTVTDVRVQRLQELTEADALAEGVVKVGSPGYVVPGFDYDLAGLAHNNPVTPFAKLWDSINGKRDGCGWDANPWVVAVSFTPELRNIDAPAKAEAA